MFLMTPRYLIALPLILGLAVSAMTAQAGPTWDLATDFNFASNASTDTWQYFEQEQGEIFLLENAFTDFNGNVGLNGWTGSAAGGLFPFVLKNTADEQIDIWTSGNGGVATVLPGEIVMHPWFNDPTDDALVAWQCPQAGTFDINGSVRLAPDVEFATGDGILWTLSLGNPYSGGTVLASGDIAADDTVGDTFSIADYSFAVGDMLYLVLDAGPADNANQDASIISLTIGDVPVVVDDIPGDANRNGIVDAADAAILAANWQTQGGATWGMGDFNGDFNVDDIDATLLATNWQQPGAAAVPEPGSLAILLAGLVSLALCRRVR